ncbi:hypothetical protein [Streptomyces purpurascens]|uniref:hypothetical protein n=1 Tax=Streptomyces purpurascens TaxID=1924 RepID=UPI001672BC2D|nr:hypothetical protein [Streptomyces purpurascens]MCE7049557.1 hypothetical protein [Streptomyces purpurascens]
MNKYRIEAPVRAFTGESVGVHFAKGTGFVDDSSKEGRAAVEYFRRHGYGVFPADQETEETTEVASPADAMTNIGHGSAPAVGYGLGVQDGPTPTGGGEPFAPSEHKQDDVLTYLDRTDDETERQRVIDAEAGGKKRKAILARGEQKQEDNQ